MIILNRDGTSFDTYMNHAKQHDWWKGDTNGKSNDQIFAELRNRRVCQKCEAMAPRHGAKDRVKCPRCGYEGYAPTLDEVITNQLYR